MRDDLDIPMPAMGPAPGGNTYRVPRQRPGMDTNTKRLAIIAAGIGGTLVVLIGAWSLTGHHRAGVPVVEADSRPVREKPANAGGMQVAGRDEAILSGQADGKAALAPPAETPKPEALKAQEQAAAAPPAAQTPPASVAAAPPAPRASAATARTALPAAPVALAPPAPKPPVAAPAAARPAAPPAPKPAVAAASPAPAPSAPAPSAPAPSAPAPSAPAASAPASAAKPDGKIHVQLAAVASEQAAMQEWQRLEKKAPALFGGHRPMVSRTQHDGRTYYRLRTGGFADSAAAKGFCAQAHGKGLSCISF